LINFLGMSLSLSGLKNAPNLINMNKLVQLLFRLFGVFALSHCLAGRMTACLKGTGQARAGQIEGGPSNHLQGANATDKNVVSYTKSEADYISYHTANLIMKPKKCLWCSKQRLDSFDNPRANTVRGPASPLIICVKKNYFFSFSVWDICSISENSH
jgi:hypothetical protein